MAEKALISKTPTSKSTLVVVPCGNAKIWDKHPDAGPVVARETYVGSPFKVNWRMPSDSVIGG